MKIVLNALFVMLSLNVSAQITETRLPSSSSGVVDNISYKIDVRTNDPSHVREEIVITISKLKIKGEEVSKWYNSDDLSSSLHFGKGSRSFSDFIEILNRMVKFSSSESTETIRLESYDSLTNKYILTSSKGKDYFFVQFEVHQDPLVINNTASIKTIKQLLQEIKGL